jgi:hypothetical protein
LIGLLGMQLMFHRVFRPLVQALPETLWTKTDSLGSAGDLDARQVD